MFSVVLITVLTAGVAIGQSLEEITLISFTKQSRGILDEVVISRDSVQGFLENHRVPENSQHYATGIDQDQWAKLVLTLKDISLNEIDGLQSPTMNRAHDGAIHSSIQIELENGRKISHSFDDENPHPDLQPLLDAILEFRVPSENK